MVRNFPDLGIIVLKDYSFEPEFIQSFTHSMFDFELKYSD